MRSFCVAKVALVLAASLAFVPVQTAGAVESSAGFKLFTRDIVVSADGSYVETSHVEIYAKNGSAARQIAKQTIGYSEEMEQLDVVEAYTLKADGTRIPVPATAISTQAPQGAKSIVIDDRKQRLIVFPDVAVGDLVVYTARTEVRHPFFPGYFTIAEAASRTVSIMDERVSIVAPKTMPLKVETHGFAFATEEADATTTYRWTYRAPDALVEDNKQLADLDLNPRFFASSFKDYDEVGRAYGSITAPLTEVTPKIQAEADRITAGIVDRRQQAEKIYQWVSAHIRYVGLELGRGGVVPRSAESVLTNGYGDCKDHTVIFAALLKAKGIASDIVLINLANGYTLADVATAPGQFNHVINWLPEFALYVDTTAGVAPFGVLSVSEYGKPVVHAVATGNARRQTPVMPAGITTIAVKTTEKLDESGSFTGETRTVATGSAGVDLRLAGLDILANGPESWAARQLADLGYPGASGSLDLASPTDFGRDYTIVGRFTVAPQPQYVAGAAFQLPGGLRLFGTTGDWLMGPLWNYKLKAGDPTPCFSGEAEEELSLELPAGKHLVKLPADTKIADKHVAFTAHWSTDGHSVTVKRAFKVSVDQPLCQGDTRKEAVKVLAAIRNSFNTAELSLAGEPAT